MALKICKECGNQVSSSAKACPKCGKRLNFFSIGKLIRVVIGTIVAIIGFALLYNDIFM